MKQETKHVESCPSDGPDGEAVSPSSTKLPQVEIQNRFWIFCIEVGPSKDCQ